jgi:eukaryotic-like serine/threonine-protein kinase
LRTQRTWREILAVFVQAGRGLAAAHAGGVIHRDFKPDNVMIREDGRVVVMDFGLARPEVLEPSEDVGPMPSLQGLVRSSLTQTGSLLGTPAYMSPEQFTTARVDVRSDQFSFCVALFEAVYGQHPFPAATLMEQAVAVASGTPMIPRNGPPVPSWVRRALLRGMRREPNERWPSMTTLLDALGRKGERRLLLLAVSGLAATLLGIWIAQGVLETRARDAQIAEHMQTARALFAEARAQDANAAMSRAAAYTAFDRGDVEEGEEQFTASREHSRIGHERYHQTLQAVEQALGLDSTNVATRAFMLEALYDNAIALDHAGDHEAAAVLFERLRIYDTDGQAQARWVAPADVSVESGPSGANVRIEQYILKDRGSPLTPEPLSIHAVTPASVRLPPGSYRLTLESAGHTPVLIPLVVERSETLQVEISLPKIGEIPPGFIYIPAGRFLFGATGDDNMRRSYFSNQPLHHVTTGPYLIAENETTYADYIPFLDSLGAQEQLERMPDNTTDLQPYNTTEFHRRGNTLHKRNNRWELTIYAGDKTYVASRGELLTYPERSERARVDWTNFPIGGLDLVDVAAYLRWLDNTGRLPGARLCNEHEWERASRGADGRIYPHGVTLASSDANFNETYNRKADSMGPDPVGSYPQSRSPFGIHDATGNIFEFTTSPFDAKTYIARGGAYYFDRITGQLVNRYQIDESFSDTSFGLRVCASFPLRQ